MRVSYFCIYRWCRKYIGAFGTVLGGIDVIAFGGGIAEKGLDTRRRILKFRLYEYKARYSKNEDFNGRQVLFLLLIQKQKFILLLLMKKLL